MATRVQVDKFISQLSALAVVEYQKSLERRLKMGAPICLHRPGGPGDWMGHISTHGGGQRLFRHQGRHRMDRPGIQHQDPGVLQRPGLHHHHGPVPGV